MRRWLIPFLLLPLPALAEHHYLVGLGYLNGLVGLNLEWTGERNSVYGMPAFYTDSGGLDTDETRWVAGWRHTINRGSMNEKGFYTGLLAGDLGGEKHYERLGAGAELGYQWVKENSRWTISAALGVLEPLECSDYLVANYCNTDEELDKYDLDVEPVVVIGASYSLRY